MTDEIAKTESPKESFPKDSFLAEHAEEIESVGKDVVIGVKQVDYKDDKNIISVIITAISVRINMPRGTVKALMACFAALLLVACIYWVHLMHVWDEPYVKGAEHQKSIDQIKSAIEDGSVYVSDYILSREVILPSKDVVISGNYSYTVPAGYYSELAYFEGARFVNAQAYSFYNWEGDWYLVRTYITKENIDSKDLETIVDDRIKEALDVRNIHYDYETFECGRVLACKYEILENDEFVAFAVEYSWADDDGTVCSLEVSSSAGDYEETAKQVMSTVHRSNNAYTNDELVARDKAAWYADYYGEDFDPDDYEAWGIDPYEAMEPDMDEIRKQEAMDAWEEYYNPQPDISDGVIKP